MWCIHLTHCIVYNYIQLSVLIGNLKYSLWTDLHCSMRTQRRQEYTFEQSWPLMFFMLIFALSSSAPCIAVNKALHLTCVVTNMLSLAKGGGAADLQVRLARDAAVLGKADKMWPTLFWCSDDGHRNINNLFSLRSIAQFLLNGNRCSRLFKSYYHTMITKSLIIEKLYI